MAKLQRLGFDISVPEVFSPAPAAVAALKDRGLRPHLLVCDGNAFKPSGPVPVSLGYPFFPYRHLKYDLMSWLLPLIRLHFL